MAVVCNADAPTSAGRARARAGTARATRAAARARTRRVARTAARTRTAPCRRGGGTKVIG